MDELLSEFLAETTECLAALDQALLQLEQTPADTATLGVAFRLVHTIKGTCGFLDLARLECVAHAAEDLLGALRAGDLQITPRLITAVLGAVDCMKTIVAEISVTGAESPGDDAAVLKALRDSLTVSVAEESWPSPRSDAVDDQAPDQAAQTIRVSVAAIESLMTTVSELVLTRNQLLQLARSAEDNRFNAPLQRLSHLTSDLQEGVMKTRMQSIRHAWSTFPRLLRDLASELGKRIKLDMCGDDTELDRHVLELIRGPLTHMVRNCADHGIETPAVRIAAGKPEAGTIKLNSYHQSGTVVIEVHDDGAGLANDRIRERAITQQLATHAELSGWTERQIQRLIFLPGFTTAQAVSAVSGRGVGMDVVLTNVECLGGTIEIQSKAGAGTVFTVRIPLTLAIISALVVDAGGQRFALPQSCVAELVRIEPRLSNSADQLVIDRVDGTPVLRLRNKLLPLVSLAKLLKLPVTDDGTGPLTVVVVQLHGLLVGLLVDQVFDTEEIVVKPVSRLLRHIAVFSGNTILGDGSVIMILDPSGLEQAIGPTSSTSSPHMVERLPETSEHSGDRSAMLLVRLAHDAGPVAVPLALVARIERLPSKTIQQTSDGAIGNEARASRSGPSTARSRRRGGRW